MNWKKFDPSKKLSEQVATSSCWIAGYFYSLFSNDEPIKKVYSLPTDGYNPIDREGIYKCFNDEDEACELVILAIAERKNTRPDYPEEFTL